MKRHPDFTDGVSFGFETLLGFAASDSHAVEGPVDEEERNCEKGQREYVCEGWALVTGKGDGELDGKQSKQRGELDYWIEGDGGSVFERIADCIADDGGVVERSSLLLEFDFNDFLGVVPSGARVGHEDGLVEAKDGDRDEIADEEKRFDEGEGKRSEEDCNKDVQHALLRVF